MEGEYEKVSIMDKWEDKILQEDMPRTYAHATALATLAAATLATARAAGAAATLATARAAGAGAAF
jgi:hypothetical protein